jgi:hypothetical protein
VTLRGLLCVAPLRVLRHRPGRRITALGTGWRCEDCGRPGATLLEFEGDDGYVDPARKKFARDTRYQRRAA